MRPRISIRAWVRPSVRPSGKRREYTKETLTGIGESCQRHAHSRFAELRFQIGAMLFGGLTYFIRNCNFFFLLSSTSLGDSLFSFSERNRANFFSLIWHCSNALTLQGRRIQMRMTTQNFRSYINCVVFATEQFLPLAVWDYTFSFYKN